MLESIALQNFKAFKVTPEVPLKQLTLIYGENSSGKSTFVQSLLLLKQSLAAAPLASDSSLLDFRGPLADLGSFGAAVHNHETARKLSISLKTSTQRHSRTARLARGIVEWQIAFGFDAKTRAVHLDRLDVTYRDLKVSFTRQQKYGKYNLYLSDDRSAQNLISSWIQPDTSIPRVHRPELPDLTDEDIAWLRTWLLKTPLEVAAIVPWWSSAELREGRQGRPIGGSLDSPRRSALQSILYDWQFKSSLFQRTLANVFENLHYVGPLREPPRRVTLDTSAPSGEMGHRGERALRLLSQDSLLLKRMNSAFASLDIPYELNVKAVDLGEAEQDLGSISVLSLRDTRTSLLHTLGDVGVGISQVIPVVMQLILHERSTVIVEQPELHLHPRLQSRLADIVLDSVSERSNQVILETHSEHLLFRIQRRIRSGKLRPADVAVLYVDRSGGEAVVSEIRFNERGDMLDAWPSGFFDSKLDDLLADDGPMFSSDRHA
jgi:energy-coupling factor transporter ATP-binding protein EcfA2